jgi:hypothetical protein
VGSGNRVPGDEPVFLAEQVLDRDVQVGIRPKKGRPHLLERLRAGRIDRQRGADAHVRVEDLVDRGGDELFIPAVEGIVKAAERRLVAGYLSC